MYECRCPYCPQSYEIWVTVNFPRIESNRKVSKARRKKAKRKMVALNRRRNRNSKR